MTALERLGDRPYGTVVVVCYALVVLVVSVVDPGGSGVHGSGPLGLVGVDKWIHLAAYAGLGFGVAFAVRARRPAALLAAVVVAAGFGAGIELLQGAIPYRSLDVADGVTNGLGAVLGVSLWLVARRVSERGSGG